MLQPCIVYIIWRLKEFLYVFIITLFIVLLKKNSLPFLYVYAFLGGGGWFGKQALVLVFVLLLARTADLKTWNPQRERAGRTLPLPVSLRHAAGDRAHPHLMHELSREVRRHGSCSHVFFLHSSTGPGPLSNILQSHCCWCNWVMNSVIYILMSVFNAAS